MSRVAVWTLGPPRIARDGAEVALDTRKAVALLVYLATEWQPRSRDALVALLWPDYDQPHARATLRRTLSTLLKALPEGVLDVDRATIGLRPDADLWLDVAEMRAHLAQCRAHGHAANEVCSNCLAPLAAAVALYHEDFLAGFALRDSDAFEEWQLRQRDILRAELAGALERLTRVLIARHAFADAIPYTRRWLDLDPLHEPAHRYLMRLYDWSSQRAAALRQYRECVRTLDAELGVAPLEATTRLYEAIKEHRAPPPPLPARRAAVPARALPTDERATAAHEGAAGAGVFPPTSGIAAPAGVPGVRVIAPFVGRAAEWQAALTALRASATTGHILMVEGEAGIGKTRLVEELAARAAGAGGRVVRARCYEGETGLAYTPIATALRAALAQPAARGALERVADHWLAEAARLLPELAQLRPGLPAAPPLDSPGAQSRFFEGVSRVLVAACASEQEPGLLIFDDAQWADTGSLDLLAYLGRRLAGERLCLVLIWRSGVMPAQEQLRRLAAEAQRAGTGTRLALRRLTADDVRDWVAATLGEHPESATLADVAQRLFSETEGLPFFVSEYVRALSRGALVASARRWDVPVGVHELLASRLQAISETGAQVLTTAAVLGRSFDFETVREASGRSEEETIAALEELIEHGLIGELREAAADVPRYDFTHEKLRGLVYDDVSLARRRRLHRRAAEVLAAAQRHRREAPLAGPIAQHYLAAGDEAQAARYFELAGEQARALYANAEALALFRLALALGHPDTDALHEAIGDSATLLGEYATALPSYEAAAGQASGAALARIERKLSAVHARRGEWEAAHSHLEAALDALGDDGDDGDEASPGERARIHADWSLIARRQGQLGEAADHAGRARQMAESSSDTPALAQAYNILGMLAADQGDVGAARRDLERSLALAGELGDTAVRAAALNNLALALGRAGETEAALRHAEAALAVCVTQGDRHHEAALHNNVADLLYQAGRGDEAMAHLKQAVTIYAEIGVEAGTVQPEIWKLSEW